MHSLYDKSTTNRNKWSSSLNNQPVVTAYFSNTDVPTRDIKSPCIYKRRPHKTVKNLPSLTPCLHWSPLLTVFGRPHGRHSHRSWGTWPPLLEAKGTGGHNFVDSRLTYCSYHAFTLMSTPQIYELGWLSYLSNILSSHWPKSGGSKNFLLASLAEFVSPLSKPWRRPWASTSQPENKSYLHKTSPTCYNGSSSKTK